MLETTDASASGGDDAPALTRNRTTLGLAAAASAAAGLIHATAAGSHGGDQTLVYLFAFCAVAQLGWAGLAVVRPTRAVALSGVALNLAALLTWIASRTVGVPWIESLKTVEPVGVQDATAAVLAAVAVTLGLVSILGPSRERTLDWRPAWAVGAGAALLFLAVPAMAAGHTHDASHGLDHDHETAAAPAGGASADHDHGAMDHDHQPMDHGDAAGTGSTTVHSHADASSSVAGGSSAAGSAAGAGGHHHTIPARLDHEPTSAQLADARALIDRTKAATTQYATVEAAKAAGFASIGDAITGVEHYVNLDYLKDDAVLDPAKPESLVYKVLPNGGREFTTVMYILPPGKTMDDVPDIAGNLTVWHQHDNLCFESDSVRITGFVRNGTCFPKGTPGTPPMLHVWVTPNKCGPFAGTDAGQMTGSCVENLPS